MACGFLRELPNQGPALPISYQPYPLPAGSQFTRGNTQMGTRITCVIPIWVTPILGTEYETRNGYHTCTRNAQCVKAVSILKPPCFGYKNETATWIQKLYNKHKR